ncbi:MAG TPA: hypothetical protein PLM98_02400 [Thiolinea sp.]|nr:hypothetical protein [Thiolinea sp.]
MHALSFQISAICIGTCLIGLGLGWWAAQFFQRHSRSACYQELIRLRYAHQRLQQDLTVLSQQASSCEAEKNQALQKLAQSADLQNFEHLRSQLVHTRNQLRDSLTLVAKREQQLRRLNDLVKLLRKQARPLLPATQQGPCVNPTTISTAHALIYIPEMDPVAIQKLHMLGILNCEQLASCSTDQLKIIQRLLSETNIVPLAKWVKSARLLAQQDQTTSSIAN